MKKVISTITTSAVALLLAGSGYSQRDTQQYSYDSQSQRLSSPRDDSQSGGMPRQQQTIGGQIEGFRHIDVRSGSGMRDTHSLIRLRLEDGRNVVVDVGPKRNLDRFNLERGKQIQLTGRYANVSGRQVFRADRVRIDGNAIAIQRFGQQEGQSGFAQRSSQGQGRQTIVSGTVDGFRHINVRGSQGQRQTHTLVRIQLDNGRTTVVDLGPKNRLERLNLQKGERVRVQARQGTLDGQRILLVNRLSLQDRQGRQTAQQRSGMRSQQGATSAGSQQQVTLQGTVKGYQLMSIGTGEQQKVLLNLQLQDGRSILVDAGQYERGELDLKDLNLNDRVTIKAHRSNIGNQRMLIADTIRFENARGGSSSQQQSQSSGSSQSN